MALDDPRAFAPLTALFLPEEGDHEHAMWSLLHAVEHLGMGDGPPDYVANLATVLPALCRSAPRWASLLLMRVLNVPADADALRAYTHNAATPAEVEAITALVRSIDRVSPEVHERTRGLGLDAMVR